MIGPSLNRHLIGACPKYLDRRKPAIRRHVEAHGLLHDDLTAPITNHHPSIKGIMAIFINGGAEVDFITNNPF